MRTRSLVALSLVGGAIGITVIPVALWLLSQDFSKHPETARDYVSCSLSFALLVAGVAALSAPIWVAISRAP